ncbi:type II toxin-antitoxin system RatA family toxin [Wenzhouxiangella limi]|uniref:Type II toxin-antitoxin system RatA family toxin n=1 Tax=Wenzhouxiangella limi TaxID=2707351 RepID=A0A845URT6_9GAMM|nr:type II toxin-antitoxin system RatA family toxin [Wenzhouxiangella limi]NDY94553.1 type II toxin-antitoxin system RatA family toxin [Wenzhouxiangella limi]
MAEVHRFALVEFRPEQMFDLVCDVQRYPEFLTWVREATVHEQSETGQTASLAVTLGGIRAQFTTDNRLSRPREVEMRLREGPFEDLHGCWRFTGVGHGCRVSLDLNFRFAGSLWMRPFRRGFSRMADRMVDDFCRRAEAVHGKATAR